MYNDLIFGPGILLGATVIVFLFAVLAIWLT